MAKDGSKDGDKGGPKDGRIRLPKRIGGVKLPKELRRGGEALIAQAQSEAGRAALLQGASVVAGIAARAVQAAAQSAQVKAAHPEPAVSSEPAAPPAPGKTADAPPAADAMAQMVTAGIDAALGRLFAKR